MVNKPKNDGTWAETAVEGWLRQNGFPGAEKRRQTGTRDRGDITGCPGLCIEVKYCGNGKLSLPRWLRETKVEQENSSADHGILVVKPPGLGGRRVGQWYAAMYHQDWERLLHSVGMTTELGTLTVLSGNEVSKLFEQMHFRFRSWPDASLGEYYDPGASILIRAKGVKDPKKWYRVTTLANMVALLRMAGYGTQLDHTGKLSHNREDLGVVDGSPDERDRAGEAVEHEPQNGPELHP